MSSRDLSPKEINNLLDSIMLEITKWSEENNIDLEDPQKFEPVLQGLIVLLVQKFSKTNRKQTYFYGKVDDIQKQKIKKISFGLFIKQISEEYKN